MREPEPDLAQWYVEAYWARRKERGFAGPEDIPKDDSMDASCCIPLGWPAGKFGPARRKPLSEIAFLDRFGAPGPWSGS